MMSICKWIFLQYLLLFLMPYLWEDYYNVHTLSLIFIYTVIYTLYWEYIPKENRSKRFTFPYIIYSILVILLYCLTDGEDILIVFNLLLPIYGLACLFCLKMLSKYLNKVRKKYNLGATITYLIYGLFFIVLKLFSISWGCSNQGSFNSEKEEILERRNYLLDKLITDPQKVLDEMPTSVGIQFQGEWALYSCSMLSAALVNIAKLYPETSKENIEYIDRLISIVMAPEIRYYDTMRWEEDPLENLDSGKSHISYLSHLAWMICGYKEIGGSDKYDNLLSSLCTTMNHRILKSKSLNLQTYPDESIYVPDMLVAIVALKKYAIMNHGKYLSTVKKWVNRAKKKWIDKKTGLLVSFLDEDGIQYESVPVKGSYATLSCYYLTFIDENFAKRQYNTLKSLLWKSSLISGIKEYYDSYCYIGLDMDAGPILFELSPSGTAFMVGTSTYFNDFEIRKDILLTAEIAGHTVKCGNKRHYLLANIALVGESIMLAMRTHSCRL